MKFWAFATDAAMVSDSMAFGTMVGGGWEVLGFFFVCFLPAAQVGFSAEYIPT